MGYYLGYDHITIWGVPGLLSGVCPDYYLGYAKITIWGVSRLLSPVS
jgi:hypothetical protein